MKEEIDLIKKEGEALMQRPDINNLPKKSPVLERKVKNVVVRFPEKQRVFGKLSIKNLSDLKDIFKFPDVQKIKGEVDIKFPAVQKISGTVKAIVNFPDLFKVEVTNFPKEKEIKIPDTVSLNLTKDQSIIVKELFNTLRHAQGEGSGVDSQKANPSRYLNVRMTNGKQYVEAMHSINSNNGEIKNLLKEINNKTSSGGSTTTDSTPTGFGSGQQLVDTAGTQEQLPDVTCKSVTIKANIANTGNIYVGGSAVDSATGFVLGAGETMSLDIDNLNRLYIDSAQNNEGISYFYVS